MAGINIRPQMQTTPNVIPEVGATVTFTIEARATESSTARFTFQLRTADGYRWGDGGIETTRTATLNRDWTKHAFLLELRRKLDTGAVILVVTVESVLVSGSTTTSGTKISKAILTVKRPLKEHFAEHRTKKKLTQKDLAHELGVSASWVSDLENGASASFELIEKIKEVIE